MVLDVSAQTVVSNIVNTIIYLRFSSGFWQGHPDQVIHNEMWLFEDRLKIIMQNLQELLCVNLLGVSKEYPLSTKQRNETMKHRDFPIQMHIC